MFEFGRANDAQRQAIATTEGPLLITAGPGTGKTFTLVKRVVYLIDQMRADPSSLFVATFTEKAAKELVTRISNELADRGMSVNVNDLYVGTFHSLALRIIKENLEYTRLKTGFRVLDSFDQAYTVFQNFHYFKNIEGIEGILPNGGTWRKVERICSWVNALSEEIVSATQLQADNRSEVRVLGYIYETYNQMMAEQNLLDFAGIQVEALRMLTDQPRVRDRYTSQLRYLMIDEYQDTNYIQERLVFLLGDTHTNICVVGDDDQGLYRFRGATIRNILEFPSHFKQGKCTTIALVENYRSTPGIVEFYNSWMKTTSGKNFNFSWDNYRYDKTITAASKAGRGCPTVVKVCSKDDPDNWHEQILEFIQALEKEGKLTDYNQIAFLFSSVKHPRVTALADYLESNGVNVYSPRSAMFFNRPEIKLALGCLLLTFPEYISALESEQYHWLRDDYRSYLISCVQTANKHLTQPDGQEFLKWVRRSGKNHLSLQAPTNYSFSGLLYQMLAFEPFASILSVPMNSGVVDLRPTRNLALLSQIMGKHDYLHNISVLSPQKVRGRRRIDLDAERLFNLYLRLLYEGGITEYEDDSEYAPSGCVSFMTIHQSKGMEFPIVIVDSLSSVPRKQSDNLLESVAQRYHKRAPFEPADRIKYFDFWRLYYTAFSRPQNLLVLTSNEDKRNPSNYFREVYDPLPDWQAPSINLADFNFATVKDVNLKDSFSFTGHITVYETCSLQYKFFKDLEFQPVRVNAMLFGRLVHQTIEDVHRAVLRDEEYLITPDNVSRWFEVNYTHLSRADRTYLAEPQRQAALTQVQRYVEGQRGQWARIQDAEVDVSLVKPDYILDGTIDLIRADDGSVEIVDFKTTKKPDIIADAESIERYRRQLHVYAHLVERRTGERVSKMHLYYTGEDSSVPTITFPYTKTAVETTISVFDDVVHKILAKQYDTKAKSLKTCKECDFRAYCAIPTPDAKESL